MELWIRSQDKKQLLKVDNIQIRDYNGYFYITTDKDNQEITLGEYEFHRIARALEVLDEIQELLKQEDYLHIRKSSLNTLDDIEEPKYILRGCGLPKVYEMPEE